MRRALDYFIDAGLGDELGNPLVDGLITFADGLPGEQQRELAELVARCQLPTNPDDAIYTVREFDDGCAEAWEDGYKEAEYEVRKESVGQAWNAGYEEGKRCGLELAKTMLEQEQNEDANS